MKKVVGEFRPDVQARDALAWIEKQFAAGRAVIVEVGSRRIEYWPGHREMIRVSDDGKALLAKFGEEWVDITFVKLIARELRKG